MIELDRAQALDRRSIQMIHRGGKPGGHGIPGSSASARWALDPDNVERRRLTNQDGPSIERYPYIYPLGYIRGARRGPLRSWSGGTMTEEGLGEDGEGGMVDRWKRYDKEERR